MLDSGTHTKIDVVADLKHYRCSFFAFSAGSADAFLDRKDSPIRGVLYFVVGGRRFRSPRLDYGQRRVSFFYCRIGRNRVSLIRPRIILPFYAPHGE